MQNQDSPSHVGSKFDRHWLRSFVTDVFNTAEASEGSGFSSLQSFFPDKQVDFDSKLLVVDEFSAFFVFG